MLYPDQITLDDKQILDSPSIFHFGLCDSAEWRWSSFAEYLRQCNPLETSILVQDILLNGAQSTVLLKNALERPYRFGDFSGLILASDNQDYRGLLLSIAEFEIFARQIDAPILDLVTQAYQHYSSALTAIKPE